MKRFFDIGFSCLILMLLLPLFVLIGVGIKCTSTGPVFYRSQRVGRGGRLFNCWKFRTMYRDAEQKLAAILAADPALQKEWTTYFKLKKDPRVTTLGKWLRKSSLDELPQFWNVLMGDLSVVGPRPIVLEEVEGRLGKKKEKLLSVRPGITGIWQTSGRSNISFEERLHLETSYVDKQSFFLDLKLIFKTIPVILFPKGAY